LAEAQRPSIEGHQDAFYPMFHGFFQLSPDAAYRDLHFFLAAAERCLHLFLISVHLGFHFFLSGLCLGLVDVHLGDESTYSGFHFFLTGPLNFSKNIKPRATGLYRGFHPFLVGVHFLLVGSDFFLKGIHLCQTSVQSFASFIVLKVKFSLCLTN
jgi:hypothetical protein